jgi:hypothetical protein
MPLSLASWGRNPSLIQRMARLGRILAASRLRKPDAFAPSLFVAAPSTSAIGGCIMTSITKDYFEHDGRKYFRGNAENVEICSYGEKKDPIGPDAYLDVQNKVKSEYLTNRVKPLGSVGIDWSKASKADIGASGSLNFFGLLRGSRAIKGSLEDAEKGKFKLVGFSIDEGPLTTMLNTDASGARKYLADEGKDGRIVSEVWVVMDAEMASRFGASAGYKVSANVAGVGLDITANAGTKDETTVTLSKGSNFAYLLHKVKDWNKDKTKIENMEADYKGMS